ncbi:hypothetical protein V6R21_06660 [Limibacter armeniacum]|uniref:hypothetical protein n=1 Tax=Limibacter armeniacum TaxID=466084 RepID=UPI002FE602AB
MAKILKATFFLLSIVCFKSCLSPTLLVSAKDVEEKAIQNITVEKGAIPPDFANTHAVLLCMLHDDYNSFNRNMKKHVENEYHGEVAFVRWEDLEKEKYQDLKKFRYAFSTKLIPAAEKKEQHRETSAANSEEAAANDSLQNEDTATAYILDRLENKIYASPFTSSFYGKLTLAYMINLEKERQKVKDKTDVQ